MKNLKKTKKKKFIFDLMDSFSLTKVFEKYFSYFDGRFINKVKNLQLALKVLLVVVLIQTFGIFFISTAAISAARDKVIELTVAKNSLQEGEVYTFGKNYGSKASYEVLAFAVIEKLNNYTYRNYKWNSEWALKYVHPNNYDKVYAEISKDVDFVIKNRVVQKFEVKDYKFKRLSNSTAKIIASGYLNRSVGGVEVVKNKVYKSEAIVHISNYKAFLTGLQLTYKDNKRVKRIERKERIQNYDVNIGAGEIKDEKKK